MAKYTINPGDCISSLAAAKNFFDYHTIWDHGANAALKTRRVNPNALALNDAVEVPDIETKKEAVAIDQKHIFTVKVHPVKLRIKVTDGDDQALKFKTFTLKVGGKAMSAKPDGTGFFEQEIDPEATVGEVRVELPPAPKPKKTLAAKPKKTTPPPYPMPIVSTDFSDKIPDPPKDQNIIVCQLEIGSLSSHKVIEGVQHRLTNLGFWCDEAGNGDKTKAAVKAYEIKQQGKTKDTATDDWNDVADHSNTLHGTK